jgi:hypothetical protein
VIPGTEQVALDILVFQPPLARAASTSAPLPPASDLAVIAAGGSTGSGVSKRRANKSGGVAQKGAATAAKPMEVERSTGGWVGGWVVTRRMVYLLHNDGLHHWPQGSWVDSQYTLVLAATMFAPTTWIPGAGVHMPVNLAILVCA